MPFKTLALIIAAVIMLAAATVAALTQALTWGTGTIAAIVVVTLCLSAGLRYATRDR